MPSSRGVVLVLAVTVTLLACADRRDVGDTRDSAAAAQSATQGATAQSPTDTSGPSTLPPAPAGAAMPMPPRDGLTPRTAAAGGSRTRHPASTAPAPDNTGGTAGRSNDHPLSQQDVDHEIARAVAAWARIRTLRASFQQTVTNPITGSELTALGTMQQQKPNRLAVEFSDPAGDRIVADGEFVWVYLQSATPGQVVKMRVTDVGSANTDLLGQFLGTPRSTYDAADAGSGRVGDRRARVVTLTARPGQSLPFIRATVWVDSADALIRQFDAVDANGISRKVRILSLSPNVPVDGSAFRFVVPAGVRVVER